jgi:hypothetical protein
MGFIPISINEFIKEHLISNPKENPKDLRTRLEAALSDFNNGVKCRCGNDIWVIGSAFVGNACFTCITNESYTDDDYEIDSAIKKSKAKKRRRHIDDIDPAKIAGFFDDDGYEIIPESIKKPSLCLTCIKDNDPNEEILCSLTRHDQRDEKEFICHAYISFQK